MADVVMQVVDEKVVLTFEGADLLQPFIDQLQAMIDALPATLKGDPGSPGEGYPTRAAMAARLLPALLDDVHLNEKPREGKFLVDDAALWAAQIAADTAQTEFVISTADASKVYRRLTGVMNPAFGGALFDGVTPEGPIHVAALAALKARAVNLSPNGWYKASQKYELPVGHSYLNATTLDLTHFSIIEGQGAARFGFTGATKLRWADGVVGIRPQGVDTSGDSTVIADPADFHLGSGGLTASRLELEGGYGGVGTTAGSHCIVARSSLTLSDMYIFNWSGFGVRLWAGNVNGVGNVSGNVNLSYMQNVRIENCEHNLDVRGTDSNVFSTINLDLEAGRRWNYFNDGGIGSEAHISPHAVGGGMDGKSQTTYGGHHYAVILGQAAWCSTHSPSGDATDNTGWAHIEPGAAAGFAPAWVNGMAWEDGGDYGVAGGAIIAFVAPYAEEGGYSQFGPNCLLINPAISVRYMRGGVVIRASGGIFDVSTGAVFGGSLTAAGLHHVFGLQTGSPSVVVDVAYGASGDGQINFTRPGVALDGRLWGFAGTLLIDGSGGTLNLRISGTSIVGLTSTHFAPISDNVTKLGDAGQRWSEIFAGSATINTSDERAKIEIAAPSDALLDAWADVDWRSFKFKDAVKAKGKDGARLHFGAVAQAVRDVFKKHGIDGFALGLLCYDEWEDRHEPATVTKEVVEEYRVEDRSERLGFRLERRKVPREVPKLDKAGKPVMRRFLRAGDRFGLRYEEALSLEAAFQRRRADRVEERLSAIEARLAATNA